MNRLFADAITVMAVVGSASIGYAQQGSEFGKREYLNSCASCHGIAGKGDGPVATGLKRPPADLTRLSASNNGVFPFARTYEIIDGRLEVEMHGKREMPVWGQMFQPQWWEGPPRIQGGG